VTVECRDLAEYGEAVRAARQRHAEVFLTTPRIQRPNETWVFQEIADRKPDGVLVRNLAGLDFFRSRGLPVVADFSLNAANELTVQWLCEQGACRVTPSYDLSRSRLKELIAAAPPSRLEVAIHLHVPMFHTQHCLFCAHLSAGSNRADCRRPCGRHVVRLEDRRGVQHLVAPDALCRNTVYQSLPQSAAEIVPRLVSQGVRHFRIEFVDEQEDPQIRRIVGIYEDLLAGRVSGREAWGRLQGACHGGVTRGTLLG
jgi:putative protease